MELGGKSALIVCADADIKLAADIAMMAILQRVAIASSAVFTRQAAFEHAIVTRVARIRMGDPRSMRPPISARDRICPPR